MSLTLNDPRMNKKTWIKENHVDVLMFLYKELLKLDNHVIRIDVGVTDKIERLEDMIQSKQLLINEQNDKIQTLVTKINDCNSQIDKIEEEFLKEFVSIGQELEDLDNMCKDITRLTGSSSRKTKKKSR